MWVVGVESRRSASNGCLRSIESNGLYVGIHWSKPVTTQTRTHFNANTTKQQQAARDEMAEEPPPSASAVVEEGSSILLPDEPQPRPPSPHAVDHPGLLALISQGQFSHQTTLRTLRLHPDWLCSLPPTATTETPLHAVVRTGNLRLLEMLIAEHPSELDLQVNQTQKKDTASASVQLILTLRICACTCTIIHRASATRKGGRCWRWQGPGKTRTLRWLQGWRIW